MDSYNSDTVCITSGKQVDLDGPSLGGRQYYCVDEELVFTCTGSGFGIQWAVPPLFSSQGFVSTDPSPSTMSIVGVDASIGFQQSSPTLVTNLTIRNVPNITVECFTDVLGSTNTLSLTSSSKLCPCNLLTLIRVCFTPQPLLLKFEM